MRKFVNKKRQKRKYTKKSEAASFYSSAKTAYGMVPFLIMLIAFMSTFVISTPLRDSITNIKFTFELPQFSFSNPLNFFETAGMDVMQVGLVVWTMVQMAGTTISQSVIEITKIITYGALFIGNLIIFCATGIRTDILHTVKEFISGAALIYQGITFIVTECTVAIRFITQSVINAAIATGQFISTVTTAIGQFIATTTITTGQFVSRITFSVINTTIQFSLLLIHYIVIAAIAVAHFVVVIATIFWKTLVSIALSINVFFIRVFTAIVHIIEIPFKTLYAFWLLIKPYVDIFGNHVKMSGGDFSNMVTSLGKVSSMIGASK